MTRRIPCTLIGGREETQCLVGEVPCLLREVVGATTWCRLSLHTMTIGKDVPVDTAIGKATAVEEVRGLVELIYEFCIVAYVGANFLGEQVGDVVLLLRGHTPVEVEAVDVEGATMRAVIKLSSILRLDILVQTC